MSRASYTTWMFRRAVIAAAAMTAVLAPSGTVGTSTATVTLTQGAEHTGRMIHLILADDAFAYATALDDASGTYTLVALGSDGQIVREGPMPEAVWLESGSHTADGRTFVRAMDVDGVCSLYPFDPAALTLGDPTTVSTGSCGGQFVSDPAIPSVLWFADRTNGSIVSFDTATAAATTIPLPAAAPDHYELASVFAVTGDVAYLGFRAAFDPATEAEFTAADGSPLPALLGRFDRASGALVTAPGGSFSGSLPDGTLFSLVDGTARSIDPITLALSAEVQAIDPFAPQPIVGTRAAWTVDIDSESADLLVVAHDPASLAEVGRATVPTGFVPNTYTIVTSALVGDILMVAVANESWDEATQITTRKSVVVTANV